MVDTPLNNVVVILHLLISLGRREKGTEGVSVDSTDTSTVLIQSSSVRWVGVCRLRLITEGDPETESLEIGF